MIFFSWFCVLNTPQVLHRFHQWWGSSVSHWLPTLTSSVSLCRYVSGKPPHCDRHCKNINSATEVMSVNLLLLIDSFGHDNFNHVICPTWHWFPPHCTQHALLWYEPEWFSPNLADQTTMPPKWKKKKKLYLVWRVYYTDFSLRWVCGEFTLNLGRLYWSRSASSSSSVTSILLLKRCAFWLAWLGLDELWLGACLSNRAGRDFLSLPNTTVSQSFSHLSRQRLVNCSKTDTQTGIILRYFEFDPLNSMNVGGVSTKSQRNLTSSLRSSV